MRNNIIYFIFFSFLMSLFVSCEERSYEREEKKSDAQLATEVMNMRGANQQAAYSAISPSVKSLIWTKHLIHFRKDARLSVAQSQAIDSLLSKISPETFRDRSPQNILIKKISENIHTNFRNLFGDAFAKLLLNRIEILNMKRALLDGKITKGSPLLLGDDYEGGDGGGDGGGGGGDGGDGGGDGGIGGGGGGGGATTTCSCSNESDYCDPGPTCPYHCAYCKTDQDHCGHTNRGCGFLFLYDCTGLCYLKPDGE